MILTGIDIFLYSSRLFSRVGGGTPVPTDPPQRLVVTGLYRYCRNPMYLAQMPFLLGLFLYRGDLSLLLYAAIWAGVVGSLVAWHEEPELRRRFGEDYDRYKQQIPRWIPRRLRVVGG